MSIPPSPVAPTVQAAGDEPDRLSDEQVTAIHRSAAVRDALLAYFDRPCDQEASQVVRAILAARPTVEAPAAASLKQEWSEAQRICDLPTMDEAIRNLIEDSTGDNATCLVREVIRAIEQENKTHG